MTNIKIKNMKQTIKLGSEVKDKVTGFSGYAMGRAEYLTGCDQYMVQPKCEKIDTYPEGNWFDVGRLELISDGLNAEVVKSDEDGCDYTAPKK